MRQRTYWTGRASWHSPQMIASILFAVVAVAMMTGAAYGLREAGVVTTPIMVLIGVGSVALNVGVVHLRRNSAIYKVTGDGVECSWGFPIRTKEQRISYRKIESIRITQTIPEKLFFKTGTVEIACGASDMNQDEDLRMVGIAHPKLVRRKIAEGEDTLMRGPVDDRGRDFASSSRPPVREDHSDDGY